MKYGFDHKCSLVFRNPIFLGGFSRSVRHSRVNNHLFFFGMIIIIAGFLSACSSAAPSQSSLTLPTAPAREIVFCNYEDDMPQSVLNDFTAETGIQIRYQSFLSMEEAVEIIKTQNSCDIVNLDNRFISELSQAGLLAKLNKGIIPNIKNISANFRDMVYDPQNLYTVPYNWGTSGLLFRSDLVQATRWSDLWNPKYQGGIGLWRGEPRDGLGLALKSLGFSANSENPIEINAAVDRLIELGPRVIFLDDDDQVFSVDYLQDGKVVMALGWAADAIQGREANPAIHYVLPEEGAMLWGENFVIPAGRPNQSTAEAFLNFYLRPEVSAEVANINYYATANEASFAKIAPEILHDSVIFPPNEQLKKAEIIQPLSKEGQKLFDDGWARFLETLKSK